MLYLKKKANKFQLIIPEIISKIIISDERKSVVNIRDILADFRITGGINGRACVSVGVKI